MMAVRNRIGRGICLLVALSTVLAGQSAVIGAQGQKAKNRSHDVSLQSNGELRGQVLDQQGRPQALTKVTLLRDQRVVGYAKTDVAGQFVVRGMQPGTYQIQTKTAGKSVRVWAPRTAPPVAQQAVLLVADGNVSRAMIDHEKYGPAIRGAIAGGLITGLTYWALDHNDAS